MEYGDRLLVRLIQVSRGAARDRAVHGRRRAGLGRRSSCRASGDISQSRTQLPVHVEIRRSPPTTGVLDHPQVTLVRYSSGISAGAAVLFSTVPDRTSPPS